MCPIVCVFIVLCIFFLSITYLHRSLCVKKVLKLSCGDKACLLNDFLEPFGFSYLQGQDILTTRTDAWQHVFGHETRYDLNALSMNMVFDCEPVYFNYQGKTWLIEFWKGQYGISTGGEAGIYRAETIVPPMLRRQTVFEAVPPEEMLPIKLQLSVPGCSLFQISRIHWWLAGFVAGISTQPEDLSLEITITFPDDDMCRSFVRSLLSLGYKLSEIAAGQTTVRFTFTSPKNTCGIPWDTWVESYTLWKARVTCRLFAFFTKPFTSVMDRMLFLYYFSPFIFKRTVCSRRFCRKRYISY